ncbi:MAG TPA: Trp family transcriptional regulator [Patescibacteria group bacterium]|nr:Trp family transcriptional regulator [Patescibacteria group bacterium]
MPKYGERKAGDLSQFVGYLSSLSPHDLQKLFEGLFSPPELRMILTRFAIAKELRKGKTYKKISQDLKVGENTVARVSTHLTLFQAIKTQKGQKLPYTPTREWSQKAIVSWFKHAPADVRDTILTEVKQFTQTSDQSRFVYGSHEKG